MVKSNTRTSSDFEELNKLMEAQEIHGRSEPFRGTGEIVKVESYMSPMPGFKFKLLASNRSRTHIAVNGVSVCGEHDTNMELGANYIFDGEDLFAIDAAPGEDFVISLEHVVDCKKCLRWFRKNVQDT